MENAVLHLIVCSSDAIEATSNTVAYLFMFDLLVQDYHNKSHFPFCFLFAEWAESLFHF